MIWISNRPKIEKAIGIDTGRNTGFAIWCCKRKQFDLIKTVKIHQAMFTIKDLHDRYKILVRVEDARLRKFFGNSGREKLQGAGSVKRDASMLEDFLTDYKIPYELIAPKNNKTKLSKEQFYNLTRYSGHSSQHGRDSAMLIFGI